MSRQNTEHAHLSTRASTDRLLPPLSRNQSVASTIKTSTKSDVVKASQGAMTFRSNAAVTKSQTSRSLSDIPSTTYNRVTVIPTALDDVRSSVTDSQFSNRTSQSKLTFRSSPFKISTDSKTTHGDSLPKGKSVQETNEYNIRMPIEPVPYINQSDGLNDIYSMQPLLRESAVIDTVRQQQRIRPGAAGRRQRRVTTSTTEESLHSDRPDSGYIDD